MQDKGLTVVSLPPVKSTLPDVIVKNEANNEPEGVLGCCIISASIMDRPNSTHLTCTGRGNLACASEEDGYVDISNPTVRVSSV